MRTKDGTNKMKVKKMHEGYRHKTQ